MAAHDACRQVGLRQTRHSLDLQDCETTPANSTPCSGGLPRCRERQAAADQADSGCCVEPRSVGLSVQGAMHSELGFRVYVQL